MKQSEWMRGVCRRGVFILRWLRVNSCLWVNVHSTAWLDNVPRINRGTFSVSKKTVSRSILLVCICFSVPVVYL